MTHTVCIPIGGGGGGGLELHLSTLGLGKLSDAGITTVGVIDRSLAFL